MELLEGAPLSEHITSLKVREGEGGKGGAVGRKERRGEQERRRSG